jgi:hypothetical protein
MVLEVAIMKIKPELMEEFEKVFPQAAAVSASCKAISRTKCSAASRRRASIST